MASSCTFGVIALGGIPVAASVRSHNAAAMSLAGWPRTRRTHRGHPLTSRAGGRHTATPHIRALAARVQRHGRAGGRGGRRMRPARKSRRPARSSATIPSVGGSIGCSASRYCSSSRLRFTGVRPASASALRSSSTRCRTRSAESVAPVYRSHQAGALRLGTPANTLMIVTSSGRVRRCQHESTASSRCGDRITVPIGERFHSFVEIP